MPNILVTRTLSMFEMKYEDKNENEKINLELNMTIDLIDDFQNARVERIVQSVEGCFLLSCFLYPETINKIINLNE